MHRIPELSQLQDDFAVVLYAIIRSDGTISGEEREKYHTFFAREFGLSEAETTVLLEEAGAMDASIDLDAHIARLKKGFVNHPMKRMHFMQYLNETILSDGIGDNEYAVFERVRDGLS